MNGRSRWGRGHHNARRDEVNLVVIFRTDLSNDLR